MLTAFKREARLYDQFHRDKDYAAEAAALREKYPDATRVIEIGAGTGLLTRELRRLGFDVIAVEPSESMQKIYKKNNNGGRPLLATVQDMVGFPEKWFDLAIAHYDVLNYVPFSDIDAVMQTLRNISKEQSIEVWDLNQGVTFFTRKKSAGLSRWRVGFRFRRWAWLFFIYWGSGFPCIAKHKLYFHDPEELCPKSESDSAAVTQD